MILCPMKLCTQYFSLENLTHIFSNYQILQGWVLSLGFRPSSHGKAHGALHWVQQDGSESEQPKQQPRASGQSGPRHTWARQASRMTQVEDGRVWALQRQAGSTVHNSPAARLAKHSHIS